MLNGSPIYDADAHVVVSSRMWQDLPEEYHARRPRPVTVQDGDDLKGWVTSWFVEGRVIPHPFGQASQPANTPLGALDPSIFPGTGQEIQMAFGGQDLSDIPARLKVMDRFGIDTSVVYPSTIYALMTSDAGLESALYRSYNRYVAKACAQAPGRLKWAGLVSLRNPRLAVEGVRELRSLGASATVVFGTAGDKLLCDDGLRPFFDELTHTGLPLAIHFGMSYEPLERLSQTMYAGLILGMTLPIFLGFYAVTAGGLLDRYPTLKVAFLEFGSEWLLYVAQRMEHYYQYLMANGFPLNAGLSPRSIREHLGSGNIFVSCEGEDPYLKEELRLIGEDQFLYASDIPHPEVRENAALEILSRNDLTEGQKRKILFDNEVRFYGEP